MQLEKKAIEFLSRKYFSPIVVLQDNEDPALHSILDTNNGTSFSISNSIFFFTDKHGAIWLPIPKRFIINHKRYYPALGDSYICDEIKYTFTTKEAVITMAINYFENFLNADYGLEKKESWMLFFFDKERYDLPYNCFKYKKNNQEIKHYISNN